MLKQPQNQIQEKIIPILIDCDSLSEKEVKIENLLTVKNIVGLKFYKLRLRIWQVLNK